MQPKCKDFDMCFELLGFDILLDEDLKPWLLEVNSYPSFALDGDIDWIVKTKLIKDTLKIVLPWKSDLHWKRTINQTAVRLHEEGKTNWEIENELKLVADKYKRLRSKYEVENMGSFEKIYPIDINWAIYI